MTSLFPARLLSQLLASIVESVFHEVIRVKPCYSNDRAHYSSNLAFRLARTSDLAVAELAAQLCDRLPHHPSVAAVSSDKGYINFCLSDRYIATCLSALFTWDHERFPKDHLEDNITRQLSLPEIRLWQYAYARCASLQRLAVRENIADWDKNIQPDWLPANARLDATGAATDVELPPIVLLLAIADELDAFATNPARFAPQQRLKFGLDLAAQVLQFHDRCRLCGELPAAARARLGIIAIAQKLLWVLAPTSIDLPDSL